MDLFSVSKHQFTGIRPVDEREFKDYESAVKLLLKYERAQGGIASYIEPTLSTNVRSP
jgi:hypothetical protein